MYPQSVLRPWGVLAVLALSPAFGGCTGANAVVATVAQQGTDPRDVEITRTIHQELAKDRALSVYAKNAKVFTLQGFVTLRGPVHSYSEKTVVGAAAIRVAGIGHVNNRLEIKSKY